MLEKSYDKILKIEFEAAIDALLLLAFEYANNDYHNVDVLYTFCSLEDSFVFTNAYYRIKRRTM